MLRKSSKLFCLLLAILLLMGVTVNAEQPIIVFLDGWQMQFDVQPTIIDGRIMIPMRVIFEGLGAEVEWDSSTRTITAIRGDLVIQTTVDEKIIDVGGSTVTMDVAPKIIDGRTFVPIRFVSESVGANVEWDSNTRTITITSP